jgi:4-hydroxy-2-oxoglutarate aldolase
MTKPELRLEGLLPPIPTAFNSDESLALDQYRANIERWNRNGYSGYVVLGSNGEFVHLIQWERLKVVETARAAIPENLRLIVGCTLLSAREAVDYVREMAPLGVDAFLVNTPFYYKSEMTGERLIEHFTRVADASPVPIVLYSVPQFTGVSIAPDTVARLAEHPNICGIKESAGNLGVVEHILRQVPESFNVLCGSASIFSAALMLGACGGVLAVSSVAWRACLDIVEAVRVGDQARAKDVQLRLLPVADAVTNRFGIAGLKAALDLLGFYGGPPRSPLKVADATVRMEIKKVFHASGLFPELE